MKKKYLQELIGQQFKDWGGKKILINAPTGMGKTTFIIKVLLSYLQDRGHKLLILCNRKLLRHQYWFDLVRKYDCYGDLENSVTLMTYQQLSGQIRNANSWEGLFDEYQAIVCDEVHFFYADSDFNGFGTYALLQAIVYAGMGKEILFLSATMKEVRPLIITVIKNCWNKCSRRDQPWPYDEKCKTIIELDYSMHADFERFQCLCVPNEETLCKILADSNKKSVLFVDDKKKGAELKELLMKTGKIKSQDVTLLNADNLDDFENNRIIRNLTIAHKLLPKILISTSVLDNGVSIQDSDVGNMVIITESRLSFLQMIGRVRAESTGRCNLYFIVRSAEIFERRMIRYQATCDDYKELARENLGNKLDFYTKLVWDGEGKADFYRNSLVIMRHEYHFFTLPKSRVQGLYGEEGLYLNEFARKKNGDLYVAESGFYACAVENPLQVIYDQMAWIGKSGDELRVIGDEYKEQREKRFVEQLLAVQNYTQDEMKDFKEKLVREYKKDFFPDIPTKNGTLSIEKLCTICDEFGLTLKNQEDPEDRRKRYSIIRKEEKNDEK